MSVFTSKTPKGSGDSNNCLYVCMYVCMSVTKLQLIVSHFIVSPRTSIECHLSLQVIITGDVQIRCPYDHISLQIFIAGDIQIRFRGI